jgi:hypothetical protein
VRVRSFEAHVRERLSMGAVEYRDTSYRRPLPELLAEILEECADVGAWARIAEAVLERRSDLEPSERAATANALRSATVLAAAAHRRLTGALVVLGDVDREGAA